MDVQRYGFLAAVLGEDGAQALAKAAEQSPALGSVLVPRAVLAWLQIVEDFEGALPGVENSYLSFFKAENAYTGTIAVGGVSYGIQDASAIHLAASIGVALGIDAENVDPNLRNLDLRRLGKSLDLLVKARKAIEDLRVREALDPENGYSFDAFTDTDGPVDMTKVTVRKNENFAKRMLDPSAGYQLTHAHREGGFIGPENTTTISATHPSNPGGNVGEVTFSHNADGKTLTPELSFVAPEHRRLGLASAMYAHAEKVTGKKVIPSQMQSEHAQGLWAGNAKSPQFGAPAPQKTQPPAAPAAPAPAAKPAAPALHLAEGPGPSAAPQSAGGPMAPSAPQKQPKANAAKPAHPSVKLSRAETQRACPVCGLPNFKGERLVGCLCFGELAKHARTERTTEGVTVTFGQEWDGEAMDVFLEGLRGHGR